MVSQSQRPPSFEVRTPDYAPSAPPAGRAASVTSGRSHTRRHRHTRTHHGGSDSSSRATTNQFPVFALTGDVEIIISNASGRRENRYVLHRLFLSQCSGFFEAATRAEWNTSTPVPGRPESNGLERGDTLGLMRTESRQRNASFDGVVPIGGIRWRYVLDWEGCHEDESPLLVRRDSSSTSIFGGGSSSDGHKRSVSGRDRPPLSNEGFFRKISSTLSPTSRSTTEPFGPGDEILKDYDNLFRAMYNFPPVLENHDIALAYSECKALLKLADMYDALEIVGSRVDYHLLQFGMKLFKQIAKFPMSYLRLGYLARSQVIFKEALIHIVGQWPLGSSVLRSQVDTNVIDLLEDKVDDLRELEEKVEFKLWRLNLTTSRGERVTASNDMLGWLARSLFRDWFAESTTPPPASILKQSNRTSSSAHASQSSRTNHHHEGSSSSSSNHAASQRVAPPSATASHSSSTSTGRIYRLLGSTSTTAYLGPDELKRFLKLHPDLYNHGNLRTFERRMDEIKALARKAVAPLMSNSLELDLRSYAPLDYLTCTTLSAQELPWDA